MTKDEVARKVYAFVEAVLDATNYLPDTRHKNCILEQLDVNIAETYQMFGLTTEECVNCGRPCPCQLLVRRNERPWCISCLAREAPR